MQHSLTEKKGLNKAALQLFAALAMVIDHTAIFSSNPWLYYIMKFIGRMTIIVMCYFVAEGYHKTSNVGRYIIRMAVFAAISQIPYYLYMRWGAIPSSFDSMIYDIFRTRNVIFTLFVGLCLLTVIKSDYNILIKIVASAAALRLAKYSDWGYYAILWIVGFGLFYGSKKKQMAWLGLVLVLRQIMTALPLITGIIRNGTLTYASLFGWLAGFGALLALPLLCCYNGEKGNAPKWGFYVFYPLQFIIITLIVIIMY